MSGSLYAGTVIFYGPGRGGRIVMPENDGYAPYASTGDSDRLFAVRLMGLPMDGKFEVPYRVTIEMTYHPHIDYSALLSGANFQIHEGSRVVGEGRVEV